MRKIIFTLLCLLLGNLNAQPAALNLQNKLTRLKTMSADFTQVVAEKDGTVLQKTFGKIALERPNKFRWETKTPLEQLIITNGKKLWIYDPSLKQVTIRSLTSSINQTPLFLLLKAPGSLAKNFVITNSNNWFHLESKNKNSAFTSIIIGFSGNNLKQISFMNQLGQKTNLIFYNIILNQKTVIDFNFTIPSGVDVIDELK